MMPSRPKSLSIPRIPHQGWRLPWLQVAEGKRQAELANQVRQEQLAEMRTRNQALFTQFSQESYNRYVADLK